MAEADAHEMYKAAWQAHRSGQHEEAISLLDQAVLMTTSKQVKSVYLATMGGFFRRNENYAQAVAACNEAVSLAANNYHALTQMGLAQIEMGDYHGAAVALERAASIRPNHSVLTVLAKSQLHIDPSAAKTSAERALELNPSWNEAKAVLDAVARLESGELGNGGKES